jgi:hypothetical protein
MSWLTQHLSDLWAWLLTAKHVLLKAGVMLAFAIAQGLYCGITGRPLPGEEEPPDSRRGASDRRD